MNRIGNKWSEDEEQRMVKGLHQGRTLEDMAKDHQRTPKAMEMRRDTMLRRLSTKASTEELASLFGMPASRVKEVLATPPPAAAPHPLSSSANTNASMTLQTNDVLKRLDRIEALLEKMYKRVKSLSSK